MPRMHTLLLLVAGVPAALAATSGTFTALSFNVAGLPAILQNNDVPGDKTNNTASIGSKFAAGRYDIIHVQEDFNYHATLYQFDNHAFRTPTSGGVPFGSGLNTLSNFDWVDFTRVKWDTCSNASGADCLTPKGFTFMRVKVDDGVWIDVYNLHADAGTETDDQCARTANIQQVANYIDTWSAGNAVLVFGDTNSRYRRAQDNIATFTTQNGLADAWVALVHGGTPPSTESVCANPSATPSCETVDKLFFRGSALLDLRAASFAYAGASFLQPNGSILSDHNPVLVSFAWTLPSALRASNFFGGPHGSWFSDIPGLQAAPRGATLTLRGGSRVDGLSISTARAQHGGSGGTLTTLVLATDEWVNSVRLCQGQKDGRTRIFFFQASTSKGRTASTGATTGDCATFAPPQASWGLVGFIGQDGDEIDQLALIWAP
ncbi:endonuclease/Exonuclease/phosphatase [Auricularia subglabra TFB-10046 SS5]|uniref:Endonuclease/Exonuclease/phosphatase n=1 Tax=Auricularia subglabra (strain TFB-10046 / SS5) TaxID=717982 RepID=J0CZ07_AURST|nr:endonuclease/Exonuclease/phosphatase [Auricularia subglabra TFB-10046 SS5]